MPYSAIMKNVLVIFITTLLLTSCAKIQEPQFRRVENFELKKMGLEETVIDFKARFFNPNGFGVAVRDATFNVYVNNIYLGKFNQTNEVNVEKNADFSIPLEGKLSMQEALNIDWQTVIGKEVLIKADGNVKVGKGGLFITKDFSYEGKQVVDASY